MAAWLSFKAHCRWKGTCRFTAEEIIDAMCYSGKSLPKVNNMHKARQAFVDLEESFHYKRSRPQPVWVAESLSVAFLKNPERLVWRGACRWHRPSFLGQSIINCDLEGPFVAAILCTSPAGLQCTCILPVTDWVLRMSGLWICTQT